MISRKLFAKAIFSLFVLAATFVTSPAHATTSGVVIINVDQTFTSPLGTATVTGAIGDYGTIQGSDILGNVTKASPAPAAILKLKKGSIILDGSNFNKATAQTPLIQNKTCSFSLSGTAIPWDIIKGSGAYKSIKGTLTVTLNLGGITPRYKTGTNKGKCDFSNKYPPIASFFNAIATGTVTY